MAKKRPDKELSKSDLISRFNVAVAYQEERRYDEALSEYNAILKKNETHLPSMINLGIIHGVNGEWNDAVTVFEKAYKAEPENDAVLYNYGYALQQVKSFEKSIKPLELGLGRNPKDIGVLQCLANAYYYADQHENVIKLLRTNLSLKLRNRELALQYAASLINTGNYQECNRFLKDFVELEPNVEDAWDMLSHSLRMSGEQSKAISALKRLIQLRKGEWQLHVKLGNWYLEFGNEDEARKCFRNAWKHESRAMRTVDGLEGNNSVEGNQELHEVNHAPKSFQDSVLRISERHAANDDWKGALREFAAMARKKPDCTILMQEIAYIYQCTGEHKRAAGYYEKILGKEPHNLEAILQLIRIGMDLSDLDFAEKWVRRALELYPDVSEVHEMTGALYVSFKKYDKALTFFQHCKSRKFESCGVVLGRARCFIGLNEFKKASELLENAQKSWPDCVDVHFHLAQCQMSLKKEKLASKTLEDAREMFPRHIGIASLSADVALVTNKLPKAKQCWRHIVSMEPQSRDDYLPLIKAFLFVRKPDSALTRLKHYARYRFKGFERLYLESMIFSQKKDRHRFSLAWQELWATYGDFMEPVMAEFCFLLRKEDLSFVLQMQPEIGRYFVRKKHILDKIKIFCMGIQSKIE
jgi:tetratricopeptide (TPR) repeat protein